MNSTKNNLAQINNQKRKRRPKIITIEGIIGAGKTTFLQTFKRYTKKKVAIVEEPVDKWMNVKRAYKEDFQSHLSPTNYKSDYLRNVLSSSFEQKNEKKEQSQQFNSLKAMYENPQLNSFKFQIFALLSTFKTNQEKIWEIINEEDEEKQVDIILCERYLDTHLLFSNLRHKSGDFSQLDWLMYQYVFNTIRTHSFIPDGHIFINVSLQDAMDRVRKRARKGESLVDIQYQRNLLDEHLQWLTSTTTTTKSHIYQISPKDCSYGLDNHRHWSKICQDIESFIGNAPNDEELDFHNKKVLNVMKIVPRIDNVSCDHLFMKNDEFSSTKKMAKL